MLPAEGLKIGLEALGTFKKRVDTVLSTLEGSPASPQKIAAHALSEASFSGAGSFAEAKGLHSQYERVHERLTTLSKHLGLQIEAMQIAVMGADGNFSNLEEEQRQRFWGIQTEIRHQQLEAGREKTAAAEAAMRERAEAEAAKNGQPAPKENNEAAGGAY
jgi:TolA-binding protein